MQFYLDFIILPDGHGPDSVLGSQLLREGSGHQASPDMRRSREMTLPGFGTVRRHVLVQLHLLKSKNTGINYVFCDCGVLKSYFLGCNSM